MNASDLELLNAVRKALNGAEHSPPDKLAPLGGSDDSVNASVTHLLWAAQMLNVLIRRRTG